MKNTNMTIQQIACELSFPKASSFGTFFKKHTGLSPKNYRIGGGVAYFVNALYFLVCEIKISPQKFAGFE